MSGQEEVWEQIQAHRAKVRAANQPYAENRSFSNTVRELVKKGQLQEARQLCLNQVERKLPARINCFIVCKLIA